MRRKLTHSKTDRRIFRHTASCASCKRVNVIRRQMRGGIRL